MKYSESWPPAKIVESVRRKELIIFDGSDGSKVGLGSLGQVNVVMTNYFSSKMRSTWAEGKNELSTRRWLETK